MKPVTALSFLLILILASCASTPATTTQPSASSLPATPIPTKTLEPTATPPAIPDFMNDYIERGFDKVSSENILCFVTDETKIHFSPLEGIIYKERIIRSWLEVDYILNGEYKHGIVLDFVRRGGNDVQRDFGKFTMSPSGSNFVNPSVAWVESIQRSWTSRTPTDHTITCGILGLDTPPEERLVAGVEFSFLPTIDLQATGVQLLFEGVFPVVDGKVQSVNIPSIGEVLPIIQGEIVDKLVEN